MPRGPAFSSYLYSPTRAKYPKRDKGGRIQVTSYVIGRWLRSAITARSCY